MAIDCLILGAGQEVGKSCVVVTINGKRIMFDCGMHMGHHDHLRYPDFSKISPSVGFDGVLDCVVITHFHLDHVGALPYFTEVCGYNGPIYMTNNIELWKSYCETPEWESLLSGKSSQHLSYLCYKHAKLEGMCSPHPYPTKALAPFMLEDYRKVLVERRGEEEQFTSEDIANCMRKVIAVDLKQTIQVDKDLQIRAYYAGHVIGAAMIYAKVGDAAMVYTGDYNMTPDRHLGAAQIDRLPLDLLITESTYATTVRDSKYAREREFIQAVHKCVAGGGKVLIPAFALGRAQELCILLDDYWERMNIKVPIYFASGLTIQANMYYKMLINWTSQKVKESYAGRNPFDFKNVHKFERSMIHAPGPCVLFATPGMLTGGFSQEVFKHWAPSEMNLIALPGYCVAGTVGHKLMSRKASTVDVDKDTRIDVRCQVHQLSFSPHTDSKGIMDLVKFLSPKHVVLVHGEKPKVASLKAKIHSELGIPCYDPCNNETVSIPSTHFVKADASDAFLQACSSPNFAFSKRPHGEDERLADTGPFLRACSSPNRELSKRLHTEDEHLEDTESSLCLHVSDERVSHGVLIVEGNKKVRVIHRDELLLLLGKEKHGIEYASCFPVSSRRLMDIEDSVVLQSTTERCSSLRRILLSKLSTELQGESVRDFGEHVQVESVQIRVCLKDSCPYRMRGCDDNGSGTLFFCCSWSAGDEELAWRIINTVQTLDRA